jgi:hypothetical protein
LYIAPRSALCIFARFTVFFFKIKKAGHKIMPETTGRHISSYMGGEFFLQASGVLL